MDNVKIFVVQQGAISYERTDVVTFVFLNEAEAQAKFQYLLENRVVECSSYDSTWEALHAVAPGGEVTPSNQIA